ncbi:MAG TPA: DUF1566 domain-containing protein [Bacteroidales bacterium]|nr:DUF1566 domain-containing protein [Bacteroidales bacterium]
MKRLFIIFAFVFMVANVFAQAPEKFNYQAAVRDQNGDILDNQPVSFRISLIQGSVSGTAVYVETHHDTTNQYGLSALNIGGGTLVSGSMASIDWASGPYFIRVELDQNGGTNYAIMGITQLISVPYALHAKTAASLTGSVTESDPVFISSVAGGISATDTMNWNEKQDQLTAGAGIDITNNVISTTGSVTSYSAGDLAQGGLVFWVDETGQHGLIVSLVDISTLYVWSNVTNSAVGTTNDWDGATNTTAITGQSGHTVSSAKLCADYTNTDYGTGIYSDWYLPGVAELNHIWNNFYEVQKALTTDGNPSTIPFVRGHYWTSSEGDASSAWVFDFGIGGPALSGSKLYGTYVRAVRAF